LESVVGGVVALREGLTASTPSGTEVASEAGLDIFVGESWRYAGAQRSASRDQVGTWERFKAPVFKGLVTELTVAFTFATGEDGAGCTFIHTVGFDFHGIWRELTNILVHFSDRHFKISRIQDCQSSLNSSDFFHQVLFNWSVILQM
jgi:hypothetical protein